MKKLPLLKRPYFAKRILEVGGGHSPYSGVTHAVDKYPDDNYQRGGSVVLPSGALFSEGDLEALPFPPGESFDFIYASHIFEHLHNPQKAAHEINRVARRGYIETPSPLREQLACPIPFDEANDFHTLFCWSKAGSLHFIRKSEKTIGQFPATKTGLIARALFNLQRSGPGFDLEPLLSRPVKTTYHHFSKKLEIREHADFIQASEAGCCAYETAIRTLLFDVSFPVRLRSKRFRKLHSVLAELKIAK